MPDTPHEMKDRVLDAIRTKHIAPRPRWHFLLREGVVWFSALFALAVGSVATALTLYILGASPWMIRTLSFSEAHVVFEALPYLWFVLLGIGLFYTIHALRMTRGGYRYASSWLVAVALGLSVFLGSVLYVSGFGLELDEYLLAHVPAYGPMAGFRAEHYHMPAHGVLAGRVVHYEDGILTLEDLMGREVVVRVLPDTELVPALPLEGGMVRIMGTTTVGGIFEAHIIRVFQGRGGRMHHTGEGGEPRRPHVSLPKVR